MKVGFDNVKKSRLARVNHQGMMWHSSATPSINFSLGSEYERTNDATCSYAFRLIKNIFSPSGVAAILNHYQAHVDRENWVLTALCFSWVMGQSHVAQ